MTDESTPLLKDNNANRDSPLNGVAAEQCRRYCRRLVSVMSSLCLGGCLLGGKDNCMERRTVSELRWIVCYFVVAISSAVFQSFILPMAHLNVFWNFVLSVGVSEAVNTLVELDIGRHVRAFGAVFTIYIDSHVFSWIERQNEKGSKS